MLNPILEAVKTYSIPGVGDQGTTTLRPFRYQNSMTKVRHQ